MPETVADGSHEDGRLRGRLGVHPTLVHEWLIALDDHHVMWPADAQPLHLVSDLLAALDDDGVIRAQ